MVWEVYKLDQTTLKPLATDLVQETFTDALHQTYKGLQKEVYTPL